MGTKRAGWVRRPGAKRGPQTGRNPTDRGKIGAKHHLVVDQQGIPLAATLSAANTHDSKMMEARLDAIPAVRDRRGRPRRRPTKAHLDKGYDYPRCRRALRRRPTQPHPASAPARLEIRQSRPHAAALPRPRPTQNSGRHPQILPDQTRHESARRGPTTHRAHHPARPRHLRIIVLNLHVPHM